MITVGLSYIFNIINTLYDQNEQLGKRELEVWRNFGGYIEEIKYSGYPSDSVYLNKSSNYIFVYE